MDTGEHLWNTREAHPRRDSGAVPGSPYNRETTTGRWVIPTVVWSAGVVSPSPMSAGWAARESEGQPMEPRYSHEAYRVDQHGKRTSRWRITQGIASEFIHHLPSLFGAGRATANRPVFRAQLRSRRSVGH